MKIELMTAQQIRDGIVSKKFTATEVVEAFLKELTK